MLSLHQIQRLFLVSVSFAITTLALKWQAVTQLGTAKPGLMVVLGIAMFFIVRSSSDSSSGPTVGKVEESASGARNLRDCRTPENGPEPERLGQ